MTSLRLGLLQYGVTRIASLDGWAAKLDRLVAQAAPHADLLLLPEYACMESATAFATRASPPCAEAELRAVCDHAPAILAIMQDTARRHRLWLVPGTLPWPAPDGTVRNRAPLIGPDGATRFQDKRVMTRFEAERWGVQPGEPPATFETPWGRIGIAICYDAEFPTLVRAQVEAGAWLILVPTCTDTMHGFNRVSLSARARALENQCCVAIAPTVGLAPDLATLDENHGHAALYGPVDHGFPPDGILAQGPLDRPQWLYATIDPATLRAVRDHGAVRNHRDWPTPIPAATPVPIPDPERSQSLPEPTR